jgi:hypothetical protein
MSPNVAFPAARTEKHSVAGMKEEMQDRDKCSQQHALGAVRTAKCLSSLVRANRYIAANASMQ